MILRGVFMDNLAKAAYAYEEWYRLFQIETQESISLVNPQILQNYWISISSAKDDDKKITKQKKRDNSKGVSLFSSLILLLAKAQIDKSLDNISPENFIKLAKSIMPPSELKQLDFEKFLQNINKNELFEKRIASSIVSHILEFAKQQYKVSTFNVAHTGDLSFVQECMKKTDIHIESISKKNKSTIKKNLAESVFEIQIRHLIYEFINSKKFSTTTILPAKLKFHHRRGLEADLIHEFDLIIKASDAELITTRTYTDVLKTEDTFPNKSLASNLLKSARTGNNTYSEVLNSCLEQMPKEIVGYLNSNIGSKEEVKKLINLQLYIALTVTPSNFVNPYLICQRALYLSSLIALLEYTKDKTDLDYRISKIKENYEKLKCATVNVARVWLLYLLDRNEFQPNKSSLEDWVEATFRCCVTKDQLVLSVNELKNKKAYFSNLKNSNIRSSKVLKSLEGSKNEDFAAWAQKYEIQTADYIDDLKATSEIIFKKLNLTATNTLFYDQLFLDNNHYLLYSWDSIYKGKDVDAFVLETIFSSINTFSSLNKKLGDVEVSRKKWNEILSKTGAKSTDVFRKFNSVFFESIDPIKKQKIVTSRNNPLKKIDLSVQINNRYKVISELGSGGNGFVVKAADNNLYREVAIKLNATSEFTHPEIFKREARILATLKHENIIQIYDFINVDSSVFKQKINAEVYGLVSEYHPGALQLDKYLKNNQLSNDQKIKLFQKICDGVIAAHERNLIHCDLKPQNIIVTKEGIPKLIDFGSSSYEDISSQYSGSIQWSSPNVLNGETAKKTDDIYSLILILLYMFELDFHLLANKEIDFFDPFSSDSSANKKITKKTTSNTEAAKKHIESQSLLIEALLLSHYLMQLGWHRTSSNWEKVIGFDDLDKNIEKDYFNFCGNNKEYNKFLSNLHNNIFLVHDNEQRLSSFLEVLLMGLLTSTSSQNEVVNIIKNNDIVDEEAHPQLCQNYLDPFNSVEELKTACYALTDTASNSMKGEFSLINQASINGQVLSKSYIKGLPQLSDYEDERINEVKCQFNTFGMDYLFSDSLVTLSSGEFARLYFYTDGIDIDIFSNHPTLKQLEKAPFVDVLE
jgi:serine/threonine protein kinase